MSVLQGSTNAEYHANRTHLSSSQLKLLLKDPAAYYKKYVLGISDEEENNPAFTVGSFMHSLILEPYKIITDYAVCVDRRGQAYKDFEKANASKTIVTASQVKACEAMYKSFKACTEATKLISGGEAELSMVATIKNVPVKARADYIKKGKYIIDLKTTAAAGEEHLFAAACERYYYDLSAALYLDIANKNFDAEHQFFWVVLSKSDATCRVYEASEERLAEGLKQVHKALDLYNSCTESGIWELKKEPPKVWPLGEYTFTEDN